MTRTESDAEDAVNWDDAGRSAARFLHFMQCASTREVIERRQRILLAADEAMEALPCWPELDDEYWAQYRRSMIDAGATDADLEYFADYLARLIVEMTVGKPEDRARLLEAMVNHFALAEMEIHICGDDDAMVRKVVFPDRPRPQ